MLIFTVFFSKILHSLESKISHDSLACLDKITFDLVEDLHILNTLTAEREVEKGRGFDSRDRTKVLS